MIYPQAFFHNRFCILPEAFGCFQLAHLKIGACQIILADSDSGVLRSEAGFIRSFWLSPTRTIGHVQRLLSRLAQCIVPLVGDELFDFTEGDLPEDVSRELAELWDPPWFYLGTDRGREVRPVVARRQGRKVS